MGFRHGRSPEKFFPAFSPRGRERERRCRPSAECCGDVAAVTSAVVLSATAWVLKGLRHVLGRHLARWRGAPWLKTTPIQCAWEAAHKNGSYLQEQFHRLRSRHGAKKAIGPLAASILTAAYHMLKHGTPYHDLAPDHFDRRAKTVQTRRLITRLHELGYAVQITPAA